MEFERESARPDPNTAVTNRRCSWKKNIGSHLAEVCRKSLICDFRTIRCKGIFIWKFLCLVLTIYITLNKTQISILSAVVMNSIIPALTVLGAFNILENQFTWLRYRTAAANGYRHLLCNLSTLNIILRIINMFRICKFNYTNLTAVALN